MKWMKKMIMITLALLLLIQISVEASAVTTGKWDLGKARQSIGSAAAQILREEPEPEAETYAGAEELDPVSDWGGWMEFWFRWLEGWH